MNDYWWHSLRLIVVTVLTILTVVAFYEYGNKHILFIGSAIATTLAILTTIFKFFPSGYGKELYSRLPDLSPIQIQFPGTEIFKAAAE
jgi:VanZ family protein